MANKKDNISMPHVPTDNSFLGIKNMGDEQENLENLEPKNIDFYSGSVDNKITKRVKSLLIILTLSALLALILWPLLVSKENGLTLDVTALPVKDEASKFLKFQYRETDLNSNPFMIKTEKIFQKSRSDHNVFHLQNLVVEAVLRTGSPIRVTASKGIYLKEEQKIHLRGEIRIISGDTYDIKTDEAIFLINDKIAFGSKNTTGTAPFGNFKASGFHIDLEKEIISLKGPVKTNFNPREHLNKR